MSEEYTPGGVVQESSTIDGASTIALIEETRSTNELFQIILTLSGYTLNDDDEVVKDKTNKDPFSFEALSFLKTQLMPLSSRNVSFNYYNMMQLDERKRQLGTAWALHLFNEQTIETYKLNHNKAKHLFNLMDGYMDRALNRALDGKEREIISQSVKTVERSETLPGKKSFKLKLPFIS